MMGEAQKDLLGALDERWDDYRKQFKAARQEISEETVHDLRVAARRLLALLGILRAMEPAPRTKKVRRFLKRQLDQLDELHDAQVMLKDVAESRQALPELAPFQAYLQQYSDDLAEASWGHVRHSRPSDLKQRVRKIRKFARKHSDHAGLRAHLLGSVDQAFADAAQAFQGLTRRSPGTIHRVRIAFKKFRYTLEAVHPLLPGFPVEYLERMRDYQDAMGRVHDTTLLLDRLREYEGSTQGPRQATQSSFDAQPIETYYRKRLGELINSYFDRKDDFDIFWRPAPDQPFPWEQNNDPLHRTPRNRGAAGQHRQRGSRQPETVDRHGPQEDAPDRPRSQGAGGTAGPDPDEPLRPGS